MCKCHYLHRLLFGDLDYKLINMGYSDLVGLWHSRLFNTHAKDKFPKTTAWFPGSPSDSV